MRAWHGRPLDSEGRIGKERSGMKSAWVRLRRIIGIWDQVCVLCVFMLVRYVLRIGTGKRERKACMGYAQLGILPLGWALGLWVPGPWELEVGKAAEETPKLVV